MELVVLGCSGSVPGPDGAASGYLLKNGGAGQDLLLDCGSGVLSAMQRTPDAHPEQCHLLFSHMHADHCSDFPSLMVWRRWHPTHSSAGRHSLIGPSIARTHLGRLGADHPDRPDDPTDTYDVTAFRPGTGRFDPQTYPAQTIGEFTIYSAPAVHTTEAYLTRVEKDGRSLVYTGDTAWTEDLVDLAQGTDVLLAEACWGATSEGKPEGMHLSGQEAGRVAHQAGVGRLILTHIPPWGSAEEALHAAQQEYTGPIELAYPSMRTHI